MKVLLIHIKELLQVRDNAPEWVAGKDMSQLPVLNNAWLLLNGDLIEDYGTMDEMPQGHFPKIMDCTDRIVLPTWCDSHTHIVFAGDRSGEFVDRLHGMSYQEIADNGGGILNSALALQNTSETKLMQQASKRLEELMYLGTGAIEIKSGYGLSPEAEIKMLRVIERLKKKYPLAVAATFLGAHAVPHNFANNKQGYIDQICSEMIPAIAKEQLASFIDVFCEHGYFSPEETDQILKAGKQFGLTPKIHVNQFTALGGVAVGVNNDALSVDHLELLTDQDIEALKGSRTMPVALPGCSFFLNIPYTPGRKLIDAGLPLAIASDYNPGSAPSGNMNFVVAAACIKMRLTPEEAINAATINGAYAMGVSADYGSITRGKKASVIITQELDSYVQLPYAFGQNHIDQVILNGRVI
ncbi:MAG: imidazolonepropionase [Cryomorphaceae bacterium BACL21 MAG-121220-bin10]|nr:MAG: imidazolonepropionase [Cryomorphaceae bacterium BACL21 MAG-121220-bin10]|tara:strand:- start:21294 stop:22529 length:1236 start_codon:yes stop_codon:yes gene_type:complete